ncbi:ABATE domain-containing protein [Lentzea sp. NPDC003310]|uniref:CGNR zinc finger domain-containing protein n=1 Tax=Lentzea sp. NPDC003310 TaxID=3154447 RepID=UPI0033AE2BBB
MTATLTDFQAAGFPMGAEPLVALDLVDTQALCLDPVRDLIADEAEHARWWALQADRLPDAAPPAISATRRLRALLRSLFEAALTGATPDPALVADLNAVAAAVPTSPRLDGWGAQARASVRWHDDYNGHPALAAIAGESIRLLADPERLGKLRACANPACSMMFLAENKRRMWCAANVCGNRARVARHYEKTRG